MTPQQLAFVAKLQTLIHNRINRPHPALSQDVQTQINNLRAGSIAGVHMQNLLDETVALTGAVGTQLTACAYTIDGKRFCLSNVTEDECKITLQGTPVTSCGTIPPWPD
jgi:hypothetical protein